jgi:hypothetical protein
MRRKAGFGFEVYVRGVVLDGVGEQRVDQAHHRLAVFVERGRQAAVVDFAGFDLVQDAVDRQFVAVILVDGARDFRFAGDQRIDQQFRMDQRAQLVQRDDVVRVGDGDLEALFALRVAQREEHVALGQLARHHAQSIGIDDRLGEIDRLVAQRFGQRVAQGGFGHETQSDQQLADRLVGFHLLEQCNP